MRLLCRRLGAISASQERAIRKLSLASIEALGEDGTWLVAAHVTNNYQRHVRLECDVIAGAVRFIPEATWGAEKVHLFAFDVA